MPTSNDGMAERIEDLHIANAFTARDATETADKRSVLRRLATGMLRTLKSGIMEDPLVTLMKKLGVDERQQCAQRAVDWYLDGRRDNPPFPQKPAMRGAARQALEGPLGREPTDVELDVIVTTLPGAINDLRTAAIPGEKLAILRALASAYLRGGD